MNPLFICPVIRSRQIYIFINILEFFFSRGHETSVKTMSNNYWGRVNKGVLGLRRVLGWSYDISLS
jgi:hypothetical protein